MKEIKFEELHIGQKVWYKGEETTIDYLSFVERAEIGFVGHCCLIFDSIKEFLSLTPPAQKKKIKLYRYTVKYSFCDKDDVNYIQSEWTAFDEKQYIKSRDKILVKIEEKEIEVEE